MQDTRKNEGRIQEISWRDRDTFISIENLSRCDRNKVSESGGMTPNVGFKKPILDPPIRVSGMAPGRSPQLVVTGSCSRT